MAEKISVTPTEIERKFLPNQLLPDLNEITPKKLTQGYMVVSPEEEVRLRSVDDHEFFMTYKGSGDLERDEYETPLTEDQFLTFWPVTKSRVVEKLRYAIPCPGTKKGIAEIDRYLKQLAGLTTIEVEFTDIQQSDAFTPPNWFGEEVTQNPNYKNKNLALKGPPTND